jgi:hypothetical protein
MSTKRLWIIPSVLTTSTSSMSDGSGGAVGTAPRAGLCEEAEAAGAAVTRVSSGCGIEDTVC